MYRNFYAKKEYTRAKKKVKSRFSNFGKKSQEVKGIKLLRKVGRHQVKPDLDFLAKSCYNSSIQSLRELMKKKMIKAITFDLWNTIIVHKDYAWTRIDFLADFLKDKNFFRDRDAISEAYTSAQALFYKVWKEEYKFISVRERLELILEKLEIQMREGSKLVIIKEFEEAILKDPPLLIDGAKSILGTLSRDYRIGLICDSGMSPGRTLREVLERAEVLKYFDSTVFSDEVGYTKPHSLIFSQALRELGVRPKEAMHVGDLLRTDIAGAKSAGMKAVWINWKDEIFQEKVPQSDYEIRALSDLLNLLDSL